MVRGGFRGPNAPALWVELDANANALAVGAKRTSAARWKLKLSGRPINPKGKREGVFLSDENRLLELPPQLWLAYSGRNVHGDRPELRKGDLVWLEPADPESTKIDRPEDVKSLQWARWGRHGQSLEEMIPQHVRPDYLRDDGLVDEVTDLFGQVPLEGGGKALAFAARLRPENLVFRDAADDPAKVQKKVTLAPLAPPHPGCIAFYRDNHDPDAVSDSDPLCGYKVYRASSDGGDKAPWLYAVQGMYGDHGELKPPKKVNKTCDLVSAGLMGTLRIAFRALTKRELAIMLQACAVPWRLGGGKPLGLGLCKVCVKQAIDEDGNVIDTSDLQSLVPPEIQQRVAAWVASQEPVAMVRYPRAAERNRNKISRGGHVWFKRHASPRMVSGNRDNGCEPGLQPLYIAGALVKRACEQGEPVAPQTPMVAGQILPPLQTEHPQDDVLYGYDGFGVEETQGDRAKRVFQAIEPFDPARHVTGQEQSGGNQGKDANFRKEQKGGRKRNG